MTQFPSLTVHLESDYSFDELWKNIENRNIQEVYFYVHNVNA